LRFETRIAATSVTAAEQSLTEYWSTGRHTTSGLTGWSRILASNTKFGIVASSNGLEALAALQATNVDAKPVLQSLRSEQMTEGCWPFKATVTLIGVTDSTSNVLIAFSTWAQVVRVDPNLTASAERGAQWLVSAQRLDGGWGLVRDESASPTRAYSTALAIRALASWSASEYADGIERGVSYLLASQTQSGSWRDSEGHDSIPITAECIRALTLASSQARPLTRPLDLAVRWTLDIGATTDLWSAPSTPGEFEEVTVDQAGSKQRVDYSYSARAAAVVALLESGRPLSQSTVRAASTIVDDAIAGRWEPYARGRFSVAPPSWMLFDISIAVGRIRKILLRSHGEVWMGQFRIVRHDTSRGWLVRRTREYYPSLAAGGVIFAAIVVLSTFASFVWPAIISLTGAVLLTLAADGLTSVVKTVLARSHLQRFRNGQ
jgi:hypothetical protein